MLIILDKICLIILFYLHGDHKNEIFKKEKNFKQNKLDSSYWNLIMINFWSYKNEYKKYRPKLNRFFDQTLKKAKFFGPNLKILKIIL